MGIYEKSTTAFSCCRLLERFLHRRRGAGLPGKASEAGRSIPRRGRTRRLCARSGRTSAGEAEANLRCVGSK